MNNLKKSIYSIIGILALSSCSHGSENNDKAIITVSIEPQRQLLDCLAGDRFQIVTMLSRGSDPETFDPSLSLRKKADQSAAYLSTGAFPFEKDIEKSLPEAVLYGDMSEGIIPLFGTHGHSHADGHHHDHNDADPHVWTSVKNMKQMAANMTKVLCRIDSANTDLYRARMRSLSCHLDSLDEAIRSEIEPGITFAIWHPSLSYFARDYGLNQLAVGFESKEMPAKRLKEVIDSAKAEDVKVLFFQKEYDSRQAKSLNEAIGSRFVEIDPLAYDWEKELKKIADEIARP